MEILQLRNGSGASEVFLLDEVAITGDLVVGGGEGQVVELSRASALNWPAIP